MYDHTDTVLANARVTRVPGVYWGWFLRCSSVSPTPPGRDSQWSPRRDIVPLPRSHPRRRRRTGRPPLSPTVQCIASSRQFTSSQGDKNARVLACARCMWIFRPCRYIASRLRSSQIYATVHIAQQNCDGCVRCGIVPEAVTASRSSGMVYKAVSPPVEGLSQSSSNTLAHKSCGFQPCKHW